MDLSYVIRHVRILRYFLKTVLDKDQRVLLKLKSTEYVPSSEDSSKPTEDQRKVRHKDLILQRYVEELQKKTIGKSDYRLLEVLGFTETIQILAQEKTKQLQMEEKINRKARLEGGYILNENVEELYQPGELNALGTSAYQPSETKTKRNSKAAELSANWQTLTQQYFQNMTKYKKDSSDDDNDSDPNDDDKQI